MDSFSVETEAGTAELAPVRNGWQVTTSERDPDRLAMVLSVAADAVAREGGGRLEYWAHEADDNDTVGPRRAGFSGYRDLWQMRCPLPVGATDLAVRPFADDDMDDFVEVNNRAFHWHPEQGGLTADDVAVTQGQDWYDPNGFLLHHRDGRLAAFCWTKQHRDTTPALGEIFVIGVDPDFHGLGIGEAISRAGLAWLARQGLRQGMLYVESDNKKAIATYSRIGFSRHHSNLAFERVV